MRAFDRLFAILIGLILLAEALLFLGISLNVGQAPIRTWLDMLGQDRLLALALFIIFGVLAAYLFSMGLRRRRSYDSIQYSTPMGDVRISVQAIEDLALRASKKVKGVRDADITVRQTSSGVSLFAEISVSPDISIPEVTSEIRDRLGSYVRETSGVGVDGVDVTIKKIAADVRSRVE